MAGVLDDDGIALMVQLKEFDSLRFELFVG